MLATCEASASAGNGGAEQVFSLSSLDNGSFAESAGTCVPWWSLRGDGVRIENGSLQTPDGASARQPIAAYAPLARGLVLRGRVEGTGELVLRAGDGRSARVPLSSGGGEPRAFELGGAELERIAGGTLVPRFELELRGGPGGARWSALEAFVPLPCPDEAALEAEVAALVRGIAVEWLDRAVDRRDARGTALLPHEFDAVTGARISSAPAGFHPLFQWLLRACACSPDPLLEAALDRYAEDYLALCLHPETGLPRLRDCAAEVPLDDLPLEVAAHLRFLLDLAETGPERHREPALAAARKMGETLLARGVQPDGSIAARYRPRDGQPSTDVVPLRRLDVPAVLVRLGARTGDPRGIAAGRSALAALEFTHYWSGDAHRIDPGFDDDLGHYGARAVTMLQARPEDALFRRFVVEGFLRYADDWRDSSRCGGSVAADEVRSWELLVQLARLEPKVAQQLPPLLRVATRAHWKGEQYGNGAWGDVTFVAFDPQFDLAVGDLPGLPANLLKGLALAYDDALGLRGDETRARFAAVLRSTVATYRRPHGFLSTIHEMPGHNSAIGSLRLLPGLVGMLEALSAGDPRSR